MSSINAGKQQVSFNWYKGTAVDNVKDISLSEPTPAVTWNIQPTSPSSYHINAAELLPSSVDRLRSLDTSSSSVSSGSPLVHNVPLPQVPSSSHSLLDAALVQEFEPVQDHIESHLSPSEPSRIRSSLYLPSGTAYTQEFNPIVDVVKSRSPKEPSRVRRHSIGSHSRYVPYVAVKHPHPVDPCVVHLGETPLKRVKVDGRWDSEDSDTFALEEYERSDRISRGVDPVLSGKLYKVQRELMTQMTPNPTSIFAPIAKGLSDSVTSIKDVILEKGQNLIDSSKDALNPHPLRDSLNAIVKDSETKFRPLSLGGEKIVFVWPRVSQSFKDAEEIARSERTSRRADPILFGRWKSINNELKSKWGPSGFVFEKRVMAKTAAAKNSLIDSASALVGKASHALEDAVEFTTGMMENLGLKKVHDAEWLALQEEKERARRINEDSVLSPSLDGRKAKLENQLLRTVNALKTKSEL